MSLTAGSLHSSSPTFNIEEVLRRVGHWLPAQGPIKDFIHHNTLHGFQHLKFHDAVRAAARFYGARPGMSGSFYLENFKAGNISESALTRALTLAFPDPEERNAARARMLAGSMNNPVFQSRASGGMRSKWSRRLEGVSLDRLTHPPLFRLIGGYLDQGLSLWRMPGADQLDFFEATGSLVQKSWLPLRPFHTKLARRLLNLSAEQACLESLKLLVGREDFYEEYLLESLLAQPGWAGLVRACEKRGESLLSPRKIRLLDYTAVTLIAEASSLQRILGEKFKPLNEWAEVSGIPGKPDEIPAWTEEENLLRVWQEAFEWNYYEGFLGGVMSAGAGTQAPVENKAWAFFCIDDRECSLRRHIEEVNPVIKTFATAGFFGLDFMYRGAGDAFAGKHCPVPILPRHLVIEEVPEQSPNRPRESTSWLRKIFSLEPQANTFFRGWILTHALGFNAALRLAASVFRPSLATVSVPPLSSVNHNARLKLSRTGDHKTQDGLWIGYSVPELADRVQSLFHSVGAEDQWPELIVFFGHGSSSVNNPYFAAYDCGACSGRPGAPNARAFAEAANMPEVRSILRTRGIEIPDTTWFVGALHDTARDQITFYDENRIPPERQAAFNEFKRSVETALANNAAERCRRFELVPEGLSPAAALAEVKARAVSLFEPRPEYNHATNAACVVGRRLLTEGIFLDRRAFLNSYDPNKDPDGVILKSILAAVVPVCGGINLEYYFSKIDPVIYGAGTKLSHNVNGLVGVMNGVEGDLLTGLPTQMTEIHDPVRLIILVEQTPQTALAAAMANPEIFQWISNEWIRYACADPMSREIFMYAEGEMRRLDQLTAPTRTWSSSLEAASGGRRNLPLGYIRRKDGTDPCF